MHGPFNQARAYSRIQGFFYMFLFLFVALKQGPPFVSKVVACVIAWTFGHVLGELTKNCMNMNSARGKRTVSDLDKQTNNGPVVA